MNELEVKAIESNYLDLQGTYRSCSVDDTLEKTKGLLSTIGITRVADITGLDTIGIPVATCIRPMAKHLSVSQGKGLSFSLAKASAIMEAMECYHMENPPTPILRGSYSKLKASHDVVNPSVFNPGIVRLENIDHYDFAWISALELHSEKTVYIPQILSNFDSSQMHCEYGFLSVTTNGIAAGNTVDEALCHALYEVIERDSLARWAVLPEEQQRISQLDLTTFDHDNKMLLARYQAAGIPIKVWDITSALNVPTFHCVIGDNDKLRNLDIFTGTGTHLSKAIALSRALTEAAQCRLTYISGNRDDILPSYYHSRGQFKALVTKAFDNGRMCYGACYQPSFSNSFKSNIEQLKIILTANNYHAIYLVDHTKKNIDIPVIQVIIPKLQFIAERM